MNNIKQTAIHAISMLPEHVSIEDIMYKLYVLDKIDKGKRDVEQGRLIEVNKLKEEVEKW